MSRLFAQHTLNPLLLKVAGLSALGLQGTCSTPRVTEVFRAPRRMDQATQRGLAQTHCCPTTL